MGKSSAQIGKPFIQRFHQQEAGMDRSVEAGQKAGLSDYLAAERTLLAWIRTGLALMGFGLAMAIYLVSVRTSAGSNKETPMPLKQSNGIIDTPSKHSVDQTAERLKRILEEK